MVLDRTGPGDSEMEAWKVQSNIEAFGYYDAAVILRKKKISFEEAYRLIFNRNPRKV